MNSGLSETFEVQSADQIINQALDMGYESFYYLCSGGKDSMCVCDFGFKNYPKQSKGIIYTMTGMSLKESRYFVLGQAKKRNWTLFFTWAKKNYVDWVVENGFGGRGVHGIVMYLLKFNSWRKFEQEHRDEKMCFISGVRRKESKRRGQSKQYKNPIDIEGGKQCFVKPFYYKSSSELWDYVGQNDIKISPVHDILNISGDCLCGCFADPKWELALIKDNYPYMFSAIKWLEKEIDRRGTPKAKRFSTWGSGAGVDDIETQKSLKEWFAIDGDNYSIQEYCGESCQVVV